MTLCCYTACCISGDVAAEKSASPDPNALPAEPGVSAALQKQKPAEDAVVTAPQGMFV